MSESQEIIALRQKIKDKIAEFQIPMQSITIHSDQYGEKTFDVPKALLDAYIYDTFEKKFNEAYQTWYPISRSGLKMSGDSPYHTDLWLSLDFPIHTDCDDVYNMDSQYAHFFSLLTREGHRLMNKKAMFSFLSNKQNGIFVGKVVFYDSPNITDKDILILPNANAKFLKQALKSGCVIVEMGGNMSHIVTVTKHDALPIILREKALSDFQESDEIFIDFSNLTLTKI